MTKRSKIHQNIMIFISGFIFSTVITSLLESSRIFGIYDYRNSPYHDDMTVNDNKNNNNNNGDKIDTTSPNTILQDDNHNNNNKNFSGIIARSYDPWPIDEHPLPCFNPERANKRQDEGFIFTKPMKVGGSTGGGVQLRLAERVATYQNQSFPACQATRGHRGADSYKHRNVHKSFVWTMLRDPTKRVISQFFHFHVSRDKVEPSDKNFMAAIDQSKAGAIAVENYYIELHRYERNKEHIVYEPVKDANQILRDYNFIAITERFEESIVVMQLLLGLNTIDVMYLSAKGAGGFDDGVYKTTCFYIVPSFITPGMKEYFESETFQKQIKYDQALYDAANKSLDLTIDDVIGRMKFETALKEFQSAQRIVQLKCKSEAIFPCTAGGQRQERTNCLYGDHGCGNACITRVMEEINNNNNKQ